MPATNTAYWSGKIARNCERDRKTVMQLAGLEWSVFTVWECEIKDRGRLEIKLREFLGGTPPVECLNHRQKPAWPAVG